jgi:hypothetical protein
MAAITHIIGVGCGARSNPHQQAARLPNRKQDGAGYGHPVEMQGRIFLLANDLRCGNRCFL